MEHACALLNASPRPGHTEMLSFTLADAEIIHWAAHVGGCNLASIQQVALCHYIHGAESSGEHFSLRDFIVVTEIAVWLDAAASVNLWQPSWCGTLEIRVPAQFGHAWIGWIGKGQRHCLLGSQHRERFFIKNGQFKDHLVLHRHSGTWISLWH